MAQQFVTYDPGKPKAVLDSILTESGLIEPNSRWSRLSGGRTNRSWRVVSGSRDVVVKLYTSSSSNPLFPNAPETEAHVLEWAKELDIAPRFLAFIKTDLGACLVYHHLKGTPWVSDAECVGKLLRKLHRIKPPSGLREVPCGSRDLEIHARQILARCKNPPEFPRIPAAADVPMIDRRVFLHGDAVPGNFIVDRGNLKLIDWQCPAVGDPCEDIATFLSPAMQLVYRGKTLSREEERAFAFAYEDQGTMARYSVLAPWYHLRMVAYCQWKAEQGAREYAAAVEQELDILRQKLSG